MKQLKESINTVTNVVKDGNVSSCMGRKSNGKENAAVVGK